MCAPLSLKAAAEQDTQEMGRTIWGVNHGASLAGCSRMTPLSPAPLKKIVFILAVLILHCFAQAFSSCGERGPLFLVVCGLLIAEHRLWGMWASVAAAPRL